MAAKPNATTQMIQIADEFGVVFAEGGMPEIAGRILGWLLVCHPPEQSLEGLRIATGASKASISTMTRLLNHLGFIERSRGNESGIAFYRLRDDPWTPFAEKRLEGSRRLVELSRRAIVALRGTPGLNRKRVEQMSEFWTFWLRHSERLIGEWKQASSASISSLPPITNTTRAHVRTRKKLAVAR
jgi:DNA-binding transcriptional regulator GbsR (MarR family)